MNARKSDLLALGFLITAVVVFVLFQVLPVSSSIGPTGNWTSDRGFTIWGDLWRYVSSPKDLDVESAVIIAAILTGTLLVFATPFLVGILSRSRILWWLVVLGSGLVLCGVTVLVGWNLLEFDPYLADYRWEIGMKCMLAYPLLNFIGILCIRKRDSGLLPGVGHSGPAVG